jgi:hypothetical protein
MSVRPSLDKLPALVPPKLSYVEYVMKNTNSNFRENWKSVSSPTNRTTKSWRRGNEIHY